MYATYTKRIIYHLYPTSEPNWGKLASSLYDLVCDFEHSMCYKVLCILPLADLEGAGAGGEGAMAPLFPSEFFFK